MNEKRSFVLYTDSSDIINRLTDEQAGSLFKAIMNYEADGILPDLDAITDIVFLTIKAHLDRNRAKYEEVRKKRSEAGKKGSRITNEKRWGVSSKVDTSRQVSTNIDTSHHKSSKSTVNVNDNDNVNDNVIVNDSDSVNDNDVDSPFTDNKVDEFKSNYLDPSTVATINQLREMRRRKAEAGQ